MFDGSEGTFSIFDAIRKSQMHKIEESGAERSAPSHSVGLVG